MAKYEEVPGVGLVEFPDDTPQNVIDSAKSGKIGFEEQAQQADQGQDGFSASRAAGILARGGISPATVAAGVGAAGAAAMGAPVAVGAGITALAGGLLELGARAYNSEIAKKYGVREEDSDKVKLPSEYLNQIKDLIGLPKAETTGERVLEAGAETAGEALATMGAGQVLAGAKYAPKAVKALGGLLKAEPAMQVAQSATGGMAQQAAKEAGSGGVGQTIAGAGGAIAPSLPGIARAGVTAVGRGFTSPETILENIQAMRGAGTEATLGQATGARPIQFAESALGVLPGGASFMAKKGQEQQAQIGSKIEQIAQELAPGATPLSAGSKMQRGLKDVFLPEARKVQNQLYADVEQFIPKGTEVDIGNTKKLLQEVTAPLPGMKATSATSILRNKVIDDLTAGLNIDTALGGGLPLESVRTLRSRIGEKLGQFQMDSDFPRAELLRLYGALSEDIKTVVDAAGPQAKSAFDRANAYTKDLHNKIDLLQPIIDRATPERVFAAAMGGQKADTTILRTVIDALPDDARREFAGAFLNKMGRAVSSGQNLEGNVFSTETFLTNWDKLGTEPKNLLFGKFGDSFKNDMNKIAKATDIMRRGSQQYRNPSGTAQKYVAAGTVGSVVTLALSNPIALIPMAKSAIGLNLAARAMTNPKFVRALAKRYDAPTSALPAFISTLATQADREDDQDLREISDALRNQAVEADLKK
jgi:hypothetical protein